VNDAQFARSFIRNTSYCDLSASSSSVGKLLLLGVPRPVVDHAISETLADVDMVDVARQAAIAYQRRLQHSPAPDDSAKDTE